MRDRLPVCVKLSALDGGQLTLPEKLFIKDADQEHNSDGSASTKKIIFDLGLKRDLSAYPPAMQSHIANRQPIIVSPDVADSLRLGGLDPVDIDIVILSHVHWDHVGTPSDFTNARFIVGSGTLDLLKRGAPHYPADTFDTNLLPFERTYELPPTPVPNGMPHYKPSDQKTQHQWSSFAGLPQALDFFGDGSLWIIDSPGHLPGHVNVLARLETNPDRWVYLGGDCCHDIRILRKEKEIGLYDDGYGSSRSVHVDTGIARETLDRISKLLKTKHIVRNGSTTECSIQAIVAHDKEWREEHPECFFPGCL